MTNIHQIACGRIWVEEELLEYNRFSFVLRNYREYLDTDSITCMEDFTMKKTTKGRLQNIRWKLEPFTSWLLEHFWEEIDPIRYTIFLYFYKEYNIYEVFDKCRLLWLTYSSASNYGRFLTKSCSWILRNKGETDRRMRKIRNPEAASNVRLKKIRGEKVEENTEKFNTALLQVLSWQKRKIRRTFSHDTYQQIEKKTDAIFYVLEIFEWINWNTIKEIVKKTDLWWWVLARIINGKLREIHQDNKKIPLLTISQWMIHHLLKEDWVK